MRKSSAGILMYRRRAGALEVLLVHPGGPYWARKDAGAWSIPKGEFEPDEEPADAARREVAEELGIDVAGALTPLGSIRQKNGKQVFAFAVEADFDCSALRSNTFRLEWPPKSGRFIDVPEVDRAQWFAPDDARAKMHAGQAELIDRLLALLDHAAGK
jgi:predicted NUDIX family NTP pyrophosphohydrolase